MNLNISRISEDLEDIKQNITDNQYKTIMEPLMAINKRSNYIWKSYLNEFLYENSRILRINVFEYRFGELGIGEMIRGSVDKHIINHPVIKKWKGRSLQRGGGEREGCCHWHKQETKLGSGLDTGFWGGEAVAVIEKRGTQ